MLEMGTPHDIRSAITGHVVSLAPEKRDKNQRGYQEQLAMDVRNQLKCAYIMSDAGREMAPDQKRFNWPDDVPEALVAVIRETLPKRLRQCDLDLPRLPRVCADCIRELNNSNTAVSSEITAKSSRIRLPSNSTTLKMISRPSAAPTPDSKYRVRIQGRYDSSSIHYHPKRIRHCGGRN